MQQNLRALHENASQAPEDLLPLWRQYLIGQDRSTATIKQYLFAVAHFLTWYEQEARGPLVMRDLTPIDIMSYRNHLQHEQKKALSTINLRISALRAWCAWLVEAGHLPNDPAAHIKLVSGESGSKREGLSASQVNALLRYAQRSREPARNYAIVQVLVQTGLRLGECAALTFADVTIGERSGMLVVRAGKGNKVRSVPLNASAREALAKLVAPRLGASGRSVKEVAATWPQKNTPEAKRPLFLSQRGEACQLSTSAMGQMIAELVRAAGDLVPPEASAHTLRHTFARNYLAQYPGDIVGLAELLGHSKLDTTRLYGKPTTAQLSTRVERLKSNAYAEEG